MELPEILLNEIRQSRVVLILGSGASKEARNDKNEEPPDGQELGRLIADKFLNGKYQKKDLAFISEIAISESSLFAVQDFIADIFNKFEPAKFHLLLSTFRWRGLATTNFDTIIEKSYYSNKERNQTLKPIISDEDRIDDLIRSRDDLMYLKLHGCITRTRYEKTPLILTPEQFINYEEGRSRLFNTLKEFGYENAFVFIGHGLQDSDIRQMLMSLSSSIKTRPMYYLVTPKIQEDEKRLWISKRIAVLEGSFEDFLTTLNQKISKNTRKIQKILPTKHPIEKEFVVSGEMSKNCYDFLTNEVDYVCPELPIENGTASKFYKGFDLGWYPIYNNLDIRRKLIDVILLDKVLANEEDRPSTVEFYLIEAEAGAGKSILLRRLAWEASMQGEAICLFIKRLGQLKYDPVYEIYRMIKKRIFLFVDNTSDNVTLIENFIIRANREKIPITIFSAERLNEWNMSCDRIEPYVTEKYKIPYLNRKEIETLINLLEINKCLGYLKDLSLEDRIKSFETGAGRQILVALHETTLGKPFEEIIIDEYREIKPSMAQSIYLSVCVLNRLQILVRAGLISRVYDVPFNEFKDHFFSPLENVVKIIQKSTTADFYYAARHSHIASIVFDNILTTEDERFNEYSKLLKGMNISYNSDREAYRQLIKGKKLIGLFPDHQTAIQIFNILKDKMSEDPYFYQQKGIYEMNRPNGSFEKANEFLNIARDLDKNDKSIVHSLAELNRFRAEVTPVSYKKVQYREKARKYLALLMDNFTSRKIALNTLIKIYIDELKEILINKSVSAAELEEIITKIESSIEDGLKEFPDESFLLTTEHDFHKLLENEDKAINALEKAFRANTRLSFIANRLSKFYYKNGDLEKAINIIMEAIEVKPNEKNLHYNLSLLLKEKDDTDINVLIYHFKHSFTKGDRNFSAQFWYARFCFESADSDLFDESKDVFKNLRNAPIRYAIRHIIQDKIMENKRPKIFTGKIISKQETYGSIKRDGFGDTVFMHENNSKEIIWSKLYSTIIVTFEIGFDFGGPTALNIKI